jgi:hypothetical protein
MKLPAGGQCDTCYRKAYYESHPEARAKRDASQKRRSAKAYAERGDEMRQRMRDYYDKKKGEGVVRVRKPQTKRSPAAIKQSVAKAEDKVYNQSSKLCALCERKVGRGEVLLWGEELEVVHKVCGWAREARDRIARREVNDSEGTVLDL